MIANLTNIEHKPVVGDLIYGSDSYYAQITRVGESVVEFNVIGQIANLQAVYDLLDLKADKTELDAYAKLAVSNVFTQPQQVPNATLPQHATNKLQVEVMVEMFKQQLRGYNLAMPDLTGKTEISAGVYRLYDNSGFTIDYEISSGNYIYNGTSQPVNILLGYFNVPEQSDYTIKLYYVSGSVSDEGRPRISFTSSDDFIRGTFDDTLTSQLNVSQETFRTQTGGGITYDNFTFKLQIEKGSTATPYTVPGQIPQYKIVGEA